MTLASLDTVSKRVVSILNANPSIYSATVSGNVGAFASNQEVQDAIFEADSNIACFAYFQSINSELSTPFTVTSDPLTHGASVPFHHGEIKQVELTNESPVTDATIWTLGIEAKNADDLIEAKVMEAYVQNQAYSFLFKVFGGTFYTTAAFGRIAYPAYERTDALRCNQNETTLIVAEAVKLLARNGSPALFSYYQNLSDIGFQRLVQDGVSTELDVDRPPAG